MADAPAALPSSQDDDYSIVKKYAAYGESYGLAAADKAQARFSVDTNISVTSSGLGAGLEKAYINAGDTPALAKKKMFTMLADLAVAGFNVGLVEAGETFVFKGDGKTINIVKDGAQVGGIDLDRKKTTIADNTRHAIDEMKRSDAANAYLDMYLLYEAAVTGTNMESLGKNWDRDREHFMKIIMDFPVDIGIADHWRAERAAVGQAIIDHGANSEEYNKAVVDYLRGIRTWLKDKPLDMSDFWDYFASELHGIQVGEGVTPIKDMEELKKVESTANASTVVEKGLGKDQRSAARKSLDGVFNIFDNTYENKDLTVIDRLSLNIEEAVEGKGKDRKVVWTVTFHDKRNDGSIPANYKLKIETDLKLLTPGKKQERNDLADQLSKLTLAELEAGKQ